MTAFVAWVAIWGVDRGRSVRDEAEVANMTETMRTVCVGRLLVDIPSKAEVSRRHETIGGFEIDTVEESDAQFHERLEIRQAEIEAKGAAADGTGGMVEVRALRANGAIGRIFAYGLNRGYVMHGGRRVDNHFMSVEAHARVSGLSFILSAKYANEERVQLAEGLLARLQLRKEDEVPRVPGFCIRRGVFADPLPFHENENVTMFASLPGHPDLGLALFSIANANPGPALLARVAEADAAAGAEETLRTSKLRSARRDINSMVGEELAERFRESNFTTGFMVNWETRGVQGELSRPYVSLEMQTGGSVRGGGKPVDSTLHRDAVLALWDRISSTIRLRDAQPPQLAGGQMQQLQPDRRALAKTLP